MGGLYPCREAVEAILSPVEGVEKKILDLGVDLAPTPMDQAIYPPNLSFEIDDINLGLVHFRDSFDLIHMRCVLGGIKDIRKTLEDIQTCLKPGGMLVLIDGDFRMYKDPTTMYPLAKLSGDPDVSGVSEDGSWMARVLWEAHETSSMAGSNIEYLKEVVDRGLWNYSLLDPETAVGGNFFTPLGSWATGELSPTSTGEKGH
ncbi:hypothetical protein FRC17_000325 [Serendipita sp. 399]|nr:hypothetical protein FRC17_000325 [Serendipita sp. 399]